MKNFTLLLFIYFISLYAVFAQKHELKGQFSYEGITAIEIDSRFFDLNIEGTNTNRVDVETEIKGKNQHYNYEIKHEKNGSNLKVWITSSANQNYEGYEETNWKDLKSFRFNYLKAVMNFKVPENINIKVKNSSGRVMANNLHGDSLRFISSSGTMRLSNLTGNIYFKLSSGRLYAENIQGDIKAVSSSGTQHWDKIEGKLRTKVSSGRILMDKVKGEIYAKSSSGTIHADDVEGIVALNTSSGRIIGENILLTKDAYFKSSSGAIKLDLMNQLDNLKFNTKASSGNIRVGKSKKVKILKENEGNIEIIGITTSGRQRYK